MSISFSAVWLVTVLLGQSPQSAPAAETGNVSPYHDANTPSDVSTTTTTTSSESGSGGNWMDVPRLTDYIEPWKKLRNDIEAKGITLDVSVIQFMETSGGGRDSRGAFRYNGATSVGLTVDFGKLVGEVFDGLTAYVWMDWRFGDDVGTKIGALTTFPNWRWGPPIGPVVGEYWLGYGKTIDDFSFQFHLGKIAYVNTFDNNAYAHSPVTQFYNVALNFNPYILDLGGTGYLPTALGVDGTFKYKFMEGLTGYVSTGVYTAEQNYGTFGFDEAFNGRDGQPPAAPWLGEFGINHKLIDCGNGPMPGNLRFGFIYSGDRVQNLNSRYDGILPSSYETGYSAFYMSHDQMVYKENADPKDDQGAGVFFRYATGNQSKSVPLITDRVNGTSSLGIEQHFSFGGQYKGLIPTRDKDVLATAYAINVLDDTDFRAANGFGDEQVWEIYYMIQVFGWLQITPDFQWLINPIDGNGRNGVYGGMRFQITF